MAMSSPSLSREWKGVRARHTRLTGNEGMTMKVLRGRSSRIAAVVVALALPVAAFYGGSAFADHQAGHTTFVGGGQVSTKVATDTDGFELSSTDVWENVDGASLSVAVPTGTYRLVKAFFTAESYCQGSGGSWCSVRIMAKKSGSTKTAELHPRSGTDFAFDAPDSGTETWEGNDVKRGIRLPAGTWTLQVQAQMVGTGSMYLDDWYFEYDSHTS